jgi:hypothetical protein
MIQSTGGDLVLLEGKMTKKSRGKIFATIVFATSAALGLAGCGVLENPESDRDAKLESILDAVKSGDGAAFCTTVNLAVPATCNETPVSTSGIPDAILETVAVSETENLHRITAANFNLAVSSRLAETSDGQLYLFELESYVIPSILLPYGGQIEMTPVLPDVPKPFMPSQEPPSFMANDDGLGYMAVEVETAPWTNDPYYAVVWGDQAQSTAEANALVICEERTALATVESFRSGGESLDFRSNFVRASRNMASIFNDGTEFERMPRIINSPRNLTFVPCEITNVASNSSQISIDWRRAVEFEGTVGVKDGNPTSFRDLYTGEYVDLKFSSSLTASVTFSLEPGGGVSVSESQTIPELPLGVVD